MSLLKVIKSASANSKHVVSLSEYPITLNIVDIFHNLKPATENPDAATLANPITGWQLSQPDLELIDLEKTFFTKLKRNLKDHNNFKEDDFIGILNPFLEKLRQKVGISIGIDSSDTKYTHVLIEKVGFLMCRDLADLVMEACVSLEIWGLVETLIVNRILNNVSYSDLVTSLVMKRRSDLLCTSIKLASDFGLVELLLILRYFLCPPKDAYCCMVPVRKEWESQALLAIEKASNKSLSKKRSLVAKEASISLMVAHDGFSTSELCLHYLLASPVVDDAILSSSISKLSSVEMMSLIRYLGKWLKKYDMFPQAGPCPKASSVLGLNACDWIPKLEDIVRWLGLVLDENFSSLVLHPEIHGELKSMEGFASSLALVARLSCNVANAIENLQIDTNVEQN